MTTLNNKMDPLMKIHSETEHIRLASGTPIADRVVSDIFSYTEKIVQKVVIREVSGQKSWKDKIDQIVISRVFGYPLMLLLLGAVFWITIAGANIPSQMIAAVLFAFQDILTHWFEVVQAPAWLHGVLVLGMYRTLAWVIAVMLPPMAIFFPLFTILEDLGYLPRVAFNLDNMFKKAKACGKQCLTMCMGFGCNAAGVVSTRIIDSPRERLIAILTNNFVPCNGRFPTLIAIASIFMASSLVFSQSLQAAGIITLIVLLGVAVTFVVSWILSSTILKGEPSSFVLELPPYRKPKFGAVLYRSIIDRTLFVLRRAIVIAAPAGAITWIMANVYIGDLSVIAYIAGALNPLAKAIGLDGFILMAFILGLPANEIVVPILLMSYLATGQLTEFGSLLELKEILIANGWTWLTAFNTMLFALLHWPCATTLLSMYKETGSKKWTFVGFIIPTVIAFAVCFIVAQTVYFFGLA
ncbi:nucleoside recognition domain-containing protein [Desulfosporosinus sp.]|uniref:nucleoside recognition domain-containing protein n=1 Tax=Desulfosporosinus sp. TaxID=157907 RepID=UPI000E995141|nr:nucleoside recognition domain-containing protein [Desulfosporosinus sp.]MBC2724157.1 ferrous iron transporter B [Desulfosporosinus sp.]MBC2724975.1 ferrous iron transporter B [Desulfosporosinus sp.]HBV86403.1 iron transporter FeoB [Desulfosporosinus sp.]